MHIMTPATKQTKFAAYETPAVAVDFLADLQYDNLIRDQHPVAEWNRILLANKEGNFENESEFNKIELWATRKPAFSKSFTPRKKVKFTMGAPLKTWECLTWALFMKSRPLYILVLWRIKQHLGSSWGKNGRLLNQVQQYLQQHKLKVPSLMMPQGVQRYRYERASFTE
jgi:hypothetical protein